jgi:hypothetical protein
MAILVQKLWFYVLEMAEPSDIVARLNPVLRYLPRDQLDPVEAWVLYHVYVATGGGEREEL